MQAEKSQFIEHMAILVAENEAIKAEMGLLRRALDLSKADTESRE